MAITHPTNAQQAQSLLRTSTPIARLSPTLTLTALCSRQEFTTLRIKRVTRKASTPKEWPLKLSFPTPPSKTVSLYSKGLLSNLQFVNTQTNPMQALRYCLSPILLFENQRIDVSNLARPQKWRLVLSQTPD